MSKEIFELIFEEFKKNGVKLIDYDFKVDTFVADPSEIATSPLFRGDEFPSLLDFSAHDKVFEDKIAELKKDYKTASELLGKYQQENESLKKRIIELENFSCQAEQETESLFEKLKQRIAELESKESAKIMRIEFHADNGVILTPLEIANSLINQNTFKVDELRELAEHLQVYCRHHNDREPETISF